MDENDRVVLGEWLSLCKAAQLPAWPYPPTRSLYERYVERTGKKIDGGKAAVELLRERFVEVSERLRRRDLAKHIKKLQESSSSI